jgi:hypothetical protein
VAASAIWSYRSTARRVERVEHRRAQLVTCEGAVPLRPPRQALLPMRPQDAHYAGAARKREKASG